MSAYAGTSGRTNKPFNPLLGETYEFVCAEQGFRFIAEKVGLPCCASVAGCKV